MLYLSFGENFNGCGVLNSVELQLGHLLDIVYCPHFMHLSILLFILTTLDPFEIAYAGCG
jgi:hypothetical protein